MIAYFAEIHSQCLETELMLVRLSPEFSAERRDFYFYLKHRSPGFCTLIFLLKIFLIYVCDNVKKW